MTTKTVYMNNSDEEDNYEYPQTQQEECSDNECEQEQEYGQEDYPDFYENLEIISEHESVQTQQTGKKGGKPRSMSFDSDSSD